MRDRQQRLERLLEELARKPHVLGAALLSRDGLAVRVAGRQDLNRETFSAMAATLMGAAEIALAELDAGRVRYVATQSDHVKMVLIGATPDLLLAVYATAEASLDGIVLATQTAAGSVAAVVAG